MGFSRTTSLRVAEGSFGSDCRGREKKMQFWWANQNFTYRREMDGGYLWSPKKSKGNKPGTFKRNPFYDTMREVCPGDVIFSFANTKISDLGIATRTAVSHPKPPDLEQSGSVWADDGWMIPVQWHHLPGPLRPKELIAELRPHLPAKYSPLQANGDGNQGVYLASVPADMAHILLRHIGPIGENILLMAQNGVEDEGAVRVFDDIVEQAISNDASLDETTRKAVVEARRGQGRFRLNVAQIERRCRVSGASDPRLLKASHIKPWRSCTTNAERLDGNNGLLLIPNIDHLFDRGYISFENDGTMLISPVVDPSEIARLGIATAPAPNVGPFSPGQAAYLAFHRESVFLHGR